MKEFCLSFRNVNSKSALWLPTVVSDTLIGALNKLANKLFRPLTPEAAFKTSDIKCCITAQRNNHFTFNASLKTTKNSLYPHEHEAII